MNRRTIGLSVALLSLAVFAVARPATACRCPNQHIPTAVWEGVGASCFWAEEDAYDKCWQEAEENCAGIYGAGTCSGNDLVVTTPCYWDEVEFVYKVRGQTYYDCWIC